MKKIYLYFTIIMLSTQYLSAQVLDATISVNGSNQLVVTINTDAKFQFNQTHTGVPSLIIKNVYAVDPPSLTTSINGGTGINFTASNGNTGSASQMGPFGFDFGAYSIRDDEVTFTDPANNFSSGDFITIKAGTIISLATFNGTPPAINPGPYTAFIISDDYLSIAAGQTVLPVELTTFSGFKGANQISLNWETASEIDNKAFEIEHSSDGETWKKIGTVDGNGTTLERSRYEFLHESPNNGENYYRLKQIDYDEVFEYSKIINIKFSDDKVLMIIPNPAFDYIALEGITEGQLTIFDTSGKIVQEEILSNGRVDISALPIGIFYIRISSGEQIFSKRLVKSSN